jgi:hypothetical protein
MSWWVVVPVTAIVTSVVVAVVFILAIIAFIKECLKLN